MWNKLKRPVQAVLLLAVVGLCIWAILPIQQKIHLGLDLQGGARVLLQLEPTKEVPTITDDVQNQVETVVAESRQRPRRRRARDLEGRLEPPAGRAAGGQERR